MNRYCTLSLSLTRVFISVPSASSFKGGVVTFGLRDRGRGSHELRIPRQDLETGLSSAFRVGKKKNKQVFLFFPSLSRGVVCREQCDVRVARTAASPCGECTYDDECSNNRKISLSIYVQRRPPTILRFSIFMAPVETRLNARESRPFFAFSLHSFLCSADQFAFHRPCTSSRPPPFRKPGRKGKGN